MNRIEAPIAPSSSPVSRLLTRRLLGIFGVLTVVSVVSALALGEWLLLGIPPALLLLFVTVVDYKKIFWLLICCLPISIEVQFSNGFGTDLPTEPLIIGLMLIYFLLIFNNLNKLQDFVGNFLRHPIALALMVHFVWIVVSALHAHDQFLAIKYVLAKFWYIVTFFLLGGIVIRRGADIKTFFWCIFPLLLIAILVTLVRHGLQGFSFDSVNYVVQPYFRNPVGYSCFLAAFFPYVLLARTWYPAGSWQRKLIHIGIVLILIGIQFSFKRAAYLALVGAAGFYFLMRWKMTRWFLLTLFLMVVVGINFMVQRNKYLDFAPNYERTITQTNFSDLVEATYKLRDISSMERVYRWVAGFRMIEREPIVGFGPNSFYPFYRGFTVRKFQTYVSDNPEHSGIHCQYLMYAVEQGVVGAFIFAFLCGMALFWGEKLYWKHADTGGGQLRRTTVAVAASLFVILMLIMVNDMIETDKIGSFFFLNLAFLISLSRVKNEADWIQ
ncbi:MAG: hypothetical protein RL757_922 [Bacteroidota bacterium]